MMSWIAFFIAVIGAFLCARTRKVAFVWLGISNLLWVFIGIVNREWAMASQQLIFYGFAIYSYLQWKKREKSRVTWPMQDEIGKVDQKYWDMLRSAKTKMDMLRREKDERTFKATYLGTFRTVKPDFVPGNFGYDRIGDGESAPWKCNCSWASEVHGDNCPEHGTPAKVYAGAKITDRNALCGGRALRPEPIPKCGFIPENTDYVACSRDAGHDGPCAHALEKF